MAVDPIIQQKADSIRMEIYGEQVRESLASGLEAMSEDVVGVEGRQDEVETQFQQVIENTTDKDVVSAPEIIAARNGEANLKARLDKENQEVTAQLAQTEINKISKGEVTIHDINKNAGKFDESYLSEELLSQITGTTPIAPLPADYSVTKDKLAFNVLETVRSKNLYNKDTVTRERYVSSDGALVTNGTYNTSDYIEIEPMTDYSFNQNYFTLAYYDSDKQFISYSAYTSKQINSPANTKYIRFSFLTALTDIFQLEKGHETTSYADYYTLPSSGINEVDIEQLSFAKHSKNLFNKKTVTTNRYITATGNLVSGSGYNVTDFIPVEQKTYALNQLEFGKISCFDSSRTFITSVDLIDGTFTPVNNTAFVRFTVTTAELDSTQLEEGLFSTSYEDYEIRIPANKITGLPTPSGGSEKVRRITVGTSNSDFTRINTALNSITDADKDNRYEIFVRRGTYNETFRTKHYVDIIGEDKYKTIVDYTGNIDTWNDTSTVFAESNMTLSNMTLIGTDTKYPLHIDKSTGAWDMVIDNVVCIHKGSLTDTTKAGTPVGIGLYPYQNLTLRDCTFIYDDVKGTQAFGASGVYFHNISDVAGTGYRKLLVERCKIKGTTYGYRPNAVSGATSAQKNDAYIVNNDITATHAEYYFAEENTDDSWNIFRKGNEYKSG